MISGEIPQYWYLRHLSLTFRVLYYYECISIKATEAALSLWYFLLKFSIKKQYFPSFHFFWKTLKNLGNCFWGITKHYFSCIIKGVLIDWLIFFFQTPLDTFRRTLDSKDSSQSLAEKDFWSTCQRPHRHFLTTHSQMSVFGWHHNICF